MKTKNKYKHMNYASTLNRLVLLILFCFLQLSVFAQGKIITGTITTASGESLPGVSIVIKGTTTGTISDVEGNYSINVPDESSVLVYSFIGYKTKEQLVAGFTTLEIVMEEELTELEQVVVIGYGVQKKIDKTGAVAQVTSEDFVGGVVTDAIQSIQGKTSGVLISKKGGDPNSGFKVKIRGASGFEANTEPLYVIDGIPGVDPTTVAPEDIETFNILKDAASTAIYGSRGSNGVIIITTKKGKSGSSNINFNTKLSVDNVAKKYELLTASEHRKYAADNGLTYIDGGASTDWQDEIYRTGITQSYNLGASGGNETSNYYASLTYANWEGVLKGTNKERTTAKINLTHKAFNNRVTFSGSLSGAFENNDYEDYNATGVNDVIYQAYSRNPTDSVYNANGTLNRTSRLFDNENPLIPINDITNLRTAKFFLGNFKTDVEIISGLIGSVNFGYTRDDHVNDYFRPKGIYSKIEAGAGHRRYENNSNKLLETTLTYNKSISNIHNLTVLAGYSWNEHNYDGFQAGGRNAQSNYIANNNLASFLIVSNDDVESYRGIWRLIGFFGRVQYNYNSKYYVSGSARYDGSTKFGENNRWGFFPTAAIGWNIDREPFMDGLSWLDQLKLRASWGQSGNQEIGEYHSRAYFEPSLIKINPETAQEVVTFLQPTVANPDLRWETTTETNIGIDYAFIQNKLSGSLEVYYKKTDDLLGQYTIPVPPNPADRIWANSGTVENKGIEFNIQIFAINKSNFQWKTNFNISSNRQKFIDLGKYAPEDGVRKEGYISGRGLVGDFYYTTGIIVGESSGSFYLPVYEGIYIDKNDTANIDNGKFLFRTPAGGYTVDVSQAKREIVGTAFPDLEIGWSNNLTFYKNWTLDLSFRSLIGNDVFNATEMYFDNPVNYPDLNVSPAALVWKDKGRTSGATPMDIYVEDASFLRLDYLAIGYSFNMKNIKWMNTLKVYVASNNLFTLTNYSGVDPETSIDGLAFGIDQYNVYPKTRTFSVGINANF